MGAGGAGGGGSEVRASFLGPIKSDARSMRRVMYLVPTMTSRGYRADGMGRALRRQAGHAPLASRSTAEGNHQRDAACAGGAKPQAVIVCG